MFCVRTTNVAGNPNADKRMAINSVWSMASVDLRGKTQMTAAKSSSPGTPFGNKPAGNARRAWIAGAVAIFLTAGVAAWMSRSDDYPRELGAPIDQSRAVTLANALAAYRGGGDARVVIRGQVGEVCRSAGCWFVLQEIREGRLHELFVDLKKRADFTISGDVAGRWATVSGRLVGTGPDVTFEADGLRLE